MQDERYAADFEALLAVCAERGLAVQTIKSSDAGARVAPQADPALLLDSPAAAALRRLEISVSVARVCALVRRRGT